jgi:hypothetical protein
MSGNERFMEIENSSEGFRFPEPQERDRAEVLARNAGRGQRDFLRNLEKL